MVSRTGIALLVFISLAGLFPSAVNWGAHFWGFLPIPLVTVCALVMIAALVPRTQNVVLGFLQRSTAVFSGRAGFPLKALWVIICCGAGLIFWFFRQKTFFLGDGYLVLRTLPVAASSGDIPASFPTAPLTGLIASGIFRFLQFLGTGNPERVAWQSLSIGAGIIAVPVVWRLAGSIVTDVRERIGVALLLLCSGTAMLFFGYVETYPLAYTTMLAFIGSCLDVRSGKGSLTTASVLLVILVLLHVGMVILLPAYLFVAIGAVRSGGWRSLVRPVLIAGVMKIALLVLLSYSPRQFLETFVRDGSSFLPLLHPDGWTAGYGLFSVWHWVDLLNLHLLVFPFALVLAGGLFAGAVVPARYRQPGVFFWVALAGPPLLWLFLNNFELGMSRDWDLASPFALVVGLGGLAGWLTMMGPSEQRVRGVILMAMITVAHTAGWVGVNAGNGSSLMRFDALLDFRFISPRGMAIAFEEIGGYRRSRGDLLGAADAYARCVVLDSTNARRWTLFANTEGLQGNIAVARDAYERAIALGSLDPEVYLNFGIILYDQGDVVGGLREVGEAAAMDSLDPVVSFTLGRMLFEGRGDAQRALPWFERTVRLDPADSIARSFVDRCRAHSEISPPPTCTRSSSMNDPVAILVIDDDLDFLTSMVALLRPLGYHVVTARNGAEGWTKLETDKPDVLLMDWVLPDTDGVALIHRMRASVEHRERYIIMVTGRSGKEDLIRGMDEGANDYLPKPFYNEELLVRIRVGIRTKRLEEKLAAQVRRTTVLEMAGSLAHEIGNPLSAVKLLQEKLVRDGRLAALPDVIRDLNALDAELDRIASLVRKAQHITNVQSKPYAGSLNIIDLNNGQPEGVGGG